MARLLAPRRRQWLQYSDESGVVEREGVGEFTLEIRENGGLNPRRSWHRPMAEYGRSSLLRLSLVLLRPRLASGPGLSRPTRLSSPSSPSLGGASNLLHHPNTTAVSDHHLSR